MGLDVPLESCSPGISRIGRCRLGPDVEAILEPPHLHFVVPRPHVPAYLVMRAVEQYVQPGPPDQVRRVLVLERLHRHIAVRNTVGSRASRTNRLLACSLNVRRMTVPTRSVWAASVITPGRITGCRMNPASSAMVGSIRTPSVMN